MRLCRPTLKKILNIGGEIVDVAHAEPLDWSMIFKCGIRGIHPHSGARIRPRQTKKPRSHSLERPQVLLKRQCGWRLVHGRHSTSEQPSDFSHIQTKEVGDPPRVELAIGWVV